MFVISERLTGGHERRVEGEVQKLLARMREADLYFQQLIDNGLYRFEPHELEPELLALRIAKPLQEILASPQLQRDMFVAPEWTQEHPWWPPYGVSRTSFFPESSLRKVYSAIVEPQTEITHEEGEFALDLGPRKELLFYSGKKNHGRLETMIRAVDRWVVGNSGVGRWVERASWLNRPGVEVRFNPSVSLLMEPLVFQQKWRRDKDDSTALLEDPRPGIATTFRFVLTGHPPEISLSPLPLDIQKAAEG